MKRPKITCPRCKGKHLVDLPKRLFSCMEIIEKLGNPTIPEIHKESQSGADVTAFNQRVRRLISAGLVKPMEGGKPKRYSIA